MIFFQGWVKKFQGGKKNSRATQNPYLRPWEEIMEKLNWDELERNYRETELGWVLEKLKGINNGEIELECIWEK